MFIRYVVLLENLKRKGGKVNFFCIEHFYGINVELYFIEDGDFILYTYTSMHIRIRRGRYI